MQQLGRASCWDSTQQPQCPDQVAVNMEGAAAGAAEGAAAYLLFPAYPDGTLAQEVDRLSRMPGVPRLTAHQVLGIFIQVGKPHGQQVPMGLAMGGGHGSVHLGARLLEAALGRPIHTG